MAFEQLYLDLVDPLLVPGVVFFEVAVVMIEAVVLFFLLERAMGKAILASFTANIVTGLLSIVYLLFSWEAIPTLERFALMIVVALLVNILVEAAVLRLFFYRTVGRGRLLKASIVMNIASYAIVIFYFLYLVAPQA